MLLPLLVSLFGKVFGGAAPAVQMHAITEYREIDINPVVRSIDYAPYVRAIDTDPVVRAIDITPSVKEVFH